MLFQFLKVDISFASANFVQMLQYNSKSLIPFICGDGMCALNICPVYIHYIECILGKTILCSDTNTVLDSPNHCGRHLGKINGHKSVYVLTWRCIQDEFYVIFMQPYLNKLLQSQTEVCVLVVNAK